MQLRFVLFIFSFISINFLYAADKSVPDPLISKLIASEGISSPSTACLTPPHDPEHFFLDALQQGEKEFAAQATSSSGMPGALSLAQATIAPHLFIISALQTYLAAQETSIMACLLSDYNKLNETKHFIRRSAQFHAHRARHFRSLERVLDEASDIAKNGVGQMMTLQTGSRSRSIPTEKKLSTKRTWQQSPHHSDCTAITKKSKKDAESSNTNPKRDQ